MSARVLSIHAGKPAPLAGRAGNLSAIAKLPIEGRVPLRENGIPADHQVDRRHHGGPLRALCAYCAPAYPRWEEFAGRTMPPGSFGENLLLEGTDEFSTCIGDVYSLGTARLRVTVPRGPCGTLMAHWACNTLAPAVKKSRLTGWYFAVVEDGEAAAGDALELLERPYPALTIARAWDLVEGVAVTPDDARTLAAYPFLTDDWKNKAARTLEKVGTR